MVITDGYYDHRVKWDRVDLPPRIAYFVRDQKVFFTNVNGSFYPVGTWHRATSTVSDLVRYAQNNHLRKVKAEMQDAWLERHGIEPCTI